MLLIRQKPSVLGVLLLICSAIGAGCFGSIGEPRRRYFTLSVEKLHPQPVTPHSLGGLLRVRDLDSDALYDRMQIVQRQSPYEISFGTQDVWAVKPGRMLADSIANALQEAQLFEGVTRELGERRPGYLLAGGVRALEVNMARTPATAHLAFDLELTRFSDNQVIWNFRCDDEAPLDRVAPKFVVEALSRILNNAVHQATAELTALSSPDSSLSRAAP